MGEVETKTIAYDFLLAICDEARNGKFEALVQINLTTEKGC
jgi:hypothetical protein